MALRLPVADNGMQSKLKAILSADVKSRRLMDDDEESIVNTITAHRQENES